MVARSSFFVASLWAPLPLVGMLAAGCLWVMMFPGTIGLGEAGRDAAYVALIAMPVVYTAIFGATYFTARALHAVNILSVWMLLVVCGIGALVAGGLIATLDYEEPRMLILAAAVFVGGFAGLAITALVWWRVASRVPAFVPAYEKLSSRSRSRRRREERATGATVEPVPAGTVLSDQLIVRWDSRLRRVQIVHPDRQRYPEPLAEIDEKALAGVSAPDAARLVGESLTRLMPGLRTRDADSTTP